MLQAVHLVRGFKIVFFNCRTKQCWQRQMFCVHQKQMRKQIRFENFSFSQNDCQTKTIVSTQRWCKQKSFDFFACIKKYMSNEVNFVNQRLLEKIKTAMQFFHSKSCVAKSGNCLQKYCCKK